MHVHIILLSALCFYQVKTAKILGFFPMPSISHQVVFRALNLELAKRGHELLVVTPIPITSENNTIDNYKEIDVSDKYKVLIKKVFESRQGEKGVVFTPTTWNEDNTKIMWQFTKDMFEHKELQKVISDKNSHFDLIFIESPNIFPTILKEQFNAPVIMFSSQGAQSKMHEIIGSPSHLLFYPNYLHTRFFNLSLYEKFQQLYIYFTIWFFKYKAMQYESDLVQSFFNKDINDAINNIDAIFCNINPIFEGNRPVPPNVIHLGALHLQPVKDLPTELKAYLDKTTRGVVYVSLGTNVRPSLMDPELLDVFIKSFKEIPYDIIWKFDENVFAGLTSNVLVGKWFPQRDLLHHPNIKAFVTQGGLQSTDEAIDAAVPLVGIPMLTDQWFNVETYVKHGIGVQLDALTMTSDDLVKGVMKVIKDESYKKNIVKLRTLIQDQPQTPMERAVWWTEYVIRHRGARHLRANTFNISWSEYLMLDVVAVLGCAFIVIITLTILLLKAIARLLFKKTKLKKQ